MKLTLERLPESRVLLEIAADDAEFAKAVDRAYRKMSQQIAMPGFRKGKAPRGMVERAYGREMFVEEANRTLMNDLYRQALEQEDIAPVGDPDVELVAAEPLAFKVTIPVYPTVEPGDYASVRVEPADAAVEAGAEDEVIESLRKANSPWVDPEADGMELGPDKVLRPKSRTPREGDQVTIDYNVTMDGEEAEAPQTDAVFIIGESGMLEPVEAQLQQMRVGQTANFDVSFAEDDESVEAGLRGKTLNYTMTLKGLKERDLLPLDDEFAKTAADVDTLADLRQRVVDNIHRDKTQAARVEKLNEIVDAMLERASFEAPAAMIDEAVDRDVATLRRQLAQRGVSLEAYLRLIEQTEDALRAEFRPEAERRLRRSLLLREIAKREGIEVADADLDAAIDEMVATTGETTEPEQMASFYRSDFVRGALQNDLFERKLFDRLIEIATDGRGAVLNAWEPEPVTTPAHAAAEGGEGVTLAEPDAAEVEAARGEATVAPDAIVADAAPEAEASSEAELTPAS
ncbi:MAG TPA: trigger factor [Thermomicrobiales bacterium]|nr:trigger factor [Thermomicrobiales bacterium]